jgi:hypothetical protein
VKELVGAKPKVMAIHINLLAEARAAEDVRRRDPVKRAIFIGLSLVAVALMWGMLVEVKVLLAKAQLTGIQQAVDLKTNAYQHAVIDLQKVAVERNSLAALEKLQAARFLQGNLLNALQRATVDGVQLTRLRLSQSFTSAGDSKSLVRKEYIDLHLDARDYSSDPGEQVNKFEEAIAKEPYFQTMLIKTNAVQLVGPPSASQPDASGKSFVTFSLECRFPEQTR